MIAQPSGGVGRFSTAAVTSLADCQGEGRGFESRRPLHKVPGQGPLDHDDAAVGGPALTRTGSREGRGGGHLWSVPTAPVDRAFAAGDPYVVNGLTDPADAYPRSSNLG